MLPTPASIALLLLLSAAAAAQETVRVKVWVPVPPQEIKRAELGYEKLPLIKVEPPQWAATVVVLYTVGVRGGVYDELAEWMELPGPRATPGLEIWARGGSKETLHVVKLASGLRAFPWRAGRGTIIYEYPLEAFLEQISHRFAGRGPVRVFSLAHYFHTAMQPIKDREYGDSQFAATTFDSLHPYLGDSGLTLFPVTDLGYPLPVNVIDGDNTKLFGTSHWLMMPVRGMALGAAWQRSDSGAMLTLDVPRRKYTKRGNPPLLRVFARGAPLPVFERPLVAGGDPVDAAAALEKLEARAMRVTLPWTMESASLRPAAGMKNEVDVCMKSARWETLPPGEMQVDVEIRPVAQERPPLSRLNGLRAVRAGRELCAGPLPFLKNIDLIITAPAEEWVTSLRLAAAER